MPWMAICHVAAVGDVDGDGADDFVANEDTGAGQTFVFGAGSFATRASSVICGVSATFLETGNLRQRLKTKRAGAEQENTRHTSSRPLHDCAQSLPCNVSRGRGDSLVVDFELTESIDRRLGLHLVDDELNPVLAGFAEIVHR